MTKLICILLIALVFEAIGVVFLNRGIKQLGDVPRLNVGSVVDVVGRGLKNSNILLGVLFEAIFFGGLLYLMSQGDVSFIWPMTSLGFVMTTLAAKFILQEQVSVARWAGVFLIMAGAGLITWTEQSKPKPVQPVLADSAKTS
jgi:drug/metabolite transporter (DMT)-like permease